MPRGKFEDLTNRQIGDWLVLRRMSRNAWLCKCKCGQLRAVFQHNLKQNRSTGCTQCKWTRLVKRRLDEALIETIRANG